MKLVVATGIRRSAAVAVAAWAAVLAMLVVVTAVVPSTARSQQSNPGNPVDWLGTSFSENLGFADTVRPRVLGYTPTKSEFPDVRVRNISWSTWSEETAAGRGSLRVYVSQGQQRDLGQVDVVMAGRTSCYGVPVYSEYRVTAAPGNTNSVPAGALPHVEKARCEPAPFPCASPSERRCRGYYYIPLHVWETVRSTAGVRWSGFGKSSLTGIGFAHATRPFGAERRSARPWTYPARITYDRPRQCRQGRSRGFTWTRISVELFGKGAEFNWTRNGERTTNVPSTTVQRRLLKDIDRKGVKRYHRVKKDWFGKTSDCRTPE